jgi:hypothetical protein
MQETNFLRYIIKISYREETRNRTSEDTNHMKV